MLIGGFEDCSAKGSQDDSIRARDGNGEDIVFLWADEVLVKQQQRLVRGEGLGEKKLGVTLFRASHGCTIAKKLCGIRRFSSYII